jgi:hypothetical protein
MKIIGIVVLMLLQFTAQAQYAPQAGLSGSTAISATSTTIAGWANNCTVQRGYIDIANPTLGRVTGGTEANSINSADGTILCMGDSGVATLTFPAAIYNGEGPDFAVFENGFTDPANGAMAFLELAFVEVSSDGINYFRFAANSNTPTNTQIPGSGVYMDASLINNLAGKYVAQYGTPFDLEELKDKPGLNVNNITHVRLVDVVGAVGAYNSRDKNNNIINDPYPTNFPSGGFDLDAVATLHMNAAGISTTENMPQVSVYPNPATDNITINIPECNNSNYYTKITTTTGNTILAQPVNAATTTVSVADYPTGIYYISISNNNGQTWVGKVVKQ